MTDIVERLRRFGAVVQGRDPRDYAVPVPAVLIIEAADEIERLRAALGLMIPHVDHMVIEAEEAAKVDTKFIRNRLKEARAALKGKSDG